MSLNLGTAVAVIDMDISGLQEKAKKAQDALDRLDKAGQPAFDKAAAASKRERTEQQVAALRKPKKRRT